MPLADEQTELLSKLLSTDLVTLLAVALVIASVVILGCLIIAWRLLGEHQRLIDGVTGMAGALTKKVEADAEQTVVLQQMATNGRDQIAALHAAGEEAKAAHLAADRQYAQLTGMSRQIDQLTTTQARIIAVLKPVALTVQGLDGQVRQIMTIGGSMADAADQIHQRVEEIKALLVGAARTIHTEDTDPSTSKE